MFVRRNTVQEWARLVSNQRPLAGEALVNA